MNLKLGAADAPPATAGTVGSVVNHVGFIVQNVQESVAKWKAAGVPVQPGNNGRLDQAYVVTPDGLRIEILENKNQPVPIRHEHVHFFLPQAAIAESQAWYARTFGAKASLRNNAPVDDIPGVQLRYNKADMAQSPTKGRVLDHIGFDVTDLQGFIKKLKANGIKLDRPSTKNEQSGVALAFITDPWGTYIELNERPKPVYLAINRQAGVITCHGLCKPCKSSWPGFVPASCLFCRRTARDATRRRCPCILRLADPLPQEQRWVRFGRLLKKPWPEKP